MKIDVLANEVSRRLAKVDYTTALNDPHGQLLRLAAQVETEWEGRARRSWIDQSTDAIPAPSASSLHKIRAAVLALRERQREFMLLHLEGLSYRQIARKARVSHATVLREIAGAYCRLRWEVRGEDFDAPED